jgi:uncharacterized membrane protein YccC
VCAGHYFESKKTFLFMQLSLLIFFLLQLPARHYPNFHPDLIDGIRGLLLGLVLATLIKTWWEKRRRSA